jgi:hypothetical protein
LEPVAGLVPVTKEVEETKSSHKPVRKQGLRENKKIRNDSNITSKPKK